MLDAIRNGIYLMKFEGSTLKNEDKHKHKHEHIKNTLQRLREPFHCCYFTPAAAYLPGMCVILVYYFCSSEFYFVPRLNSMHFVAKLFTLQHLVSICTDIRVK